MNKIIDTNLKRWLSNLAEKWHQPIKEFVHQLGEDEIENRIQNYPKVASALKTSPFNIERFADAANQCWVLFDRFTATRFNAFMMRGDRASNAIKKLIKHFPNGDIDAAKRIDNFVESAVKLGVSTPRRPDRAVATLIASLILAALYPSRFVDYRSSRWEKLAKNFNYDMPDSNASYGIWLVWAGRFAAEFSKTKTYRQYWPKSELLWGNPLWVISGLCWIGPKPQKPKEKTSDLGLDEDAKQENEPGTQDQLFVNKRIKSAWTKKEISQEIARLEKWLANKPLKKRQRIAQAIARNAKIAKLVKEQANYTCVFCNTYGFEKRSGGLYAEAHHKQELSDSGFDVPSNIVCVCPTCHRKLHYGKI